MTLAVEEMDGFPKEWVSYGQFKAVRQIKCLWSQRFAIAMGAVSSEDGFGEIYPYRPETLARAKNASILGFGKSDQDSSASDRIEYDHAKVTINYETPLGSDERSAGGGRSDGVIESFEDASEMLRLPHERFVWKGDTSLRPDEAPAMLDVGATYVLTLTRLSSIPSRLWLGVGRVNNADLSARTFGLIFQKETLLKLAPRLEHSFNVNNGVSTFQATLRFAIKAREGKDENNAEGIWGWNHVWRAQSERYERLYHRRQLPPLPNTNLEVANTYQLADLDI